MININNIPFEGQHVLPDVTVESSKPSQSKKITIVTTILIIIVVASISKIFK